MLGMDTTRESSSPLARVLEGRRVQALFQPVVRLSTGSFVGYEALCRVVDPFDRSMDEWLDLVTVHDVRDDFELACLAAIGECGAPPSDALLFVNMSASLLAHPLARAMRDVLPSRLVVELTEREVVEDYDTLRARIAEWQASGVRLAIDDTGSGWSTLRHVV
jgi:EAL domain-containing protein (putative c-di-GMP-specific phosphodiesterase class I)